MDVAPASRTTLAAIQGSSGGPVLPPAYPFESDRYNPLAMSVVSARMGAMKRLEELGSYSPLVVNLTIRDLKVKYKGSALGVVWSLLNPLIMVSIYTLVFSVLLRAVRLENYWALVLGGLLSWIFFANAAGSASVSFIRNTSLITKVAFPIEALPLASTLAHFINFAIMLAILLVVLAATHIGLGPSLVLLPAIMLAQLAFTIGVSLVLASLTVYFRDLEHIVGLALTALFYVSPILYPLDPHALPSGAAHFLPYLKLNPLSWFLESYHAVLYAGRWPDSQYVVFMLAGSVVALVGGYLFFVWLRPRIPEEV
jgi:lipopolysaccharide transport system permease protein